MINTGLNGKMDNLQPRHQVIVNFLTRNAPKRYDVAEIAKHVKLAKSTVRNEMLLLLQLSPQVQRSVRTQQRGRGIYQYYVGSPEPEELSTSLEPLSQQDFWQLLTAATLDSYVPAPAKLAWKLTWVVSELTAAGLTGELSGVPRSRQALEELTQAAASYRLTLSRLLATAEVWEDPTWITRGATEENLEKLAELVRQGLDGTARLRGTSPTPTEAKETDDHRD